MNHELRQNIHTIQNNSELTETEKSQQIFKLLNPNLPQPSKDSESDSESKYDFTLDGCKNYNRKCLMKAECCQTFVPCRLCHDENCDHKMNRFKVKEMQCKLCDTIQPVGKHCSQCKEEMGEYYCDICHMWCDNTDIFHCSDCGICLRGKREDFFHCYKCKVCLPVTLKDKHRCIENTTMNDCPVCHDTLFQTTRKITVLRCGHSIHVDCLNDSLKNNHFKCHICKKSIAEDMSFYWEAIDNFLQDQQIPEEYQKKIEIFCNDCEKKSMTDFHFIYNKCHLCNGYNTNVV